MQHSGVSVPHRHRSPNLSDTDDVDQASSSSSSSQNYGGYSNYSYSSSAQNGITPSGPLSASTSTSSSSSSSSSNSSSAHTAVPQHQRHGQQQHQQHSHSHTHSHGHQRPKLSHNHTPSGSFVRIRRKNTPAVSPPIAASNTTLSSEPNNAYATSTYSAGEQQQQHNSQTQQQRNVDQIASKTCFICYGDSSEEETVPSISVGKSAPTPRKWIHPCSCALVAHEDCLLHWVQVSKPSANKTTPASCPQCNTPYTMHQLELPLLNFIERIEAIWAKNVSKLLMVGVGVGSWTLLGLYGMWSIRRLAGERVAEELFLRKATRWLTAPLVLPVMVLSRTHLLDSILPFLPLTMILNSTLPNTQSLYAVHPSIVTDLQISYPPTPALTLCIIPWLRAAYMALRRQVFRAVLGQRRIASLASPATPNGQNGENGHGGGAQLPGEADFARNQQRNDMAAGDGGVQGGVEGVQAMFNEHTNERRIVITVASGARILAGSLVFPWAAAGVGSLLLWLAKRQTASGRWLAKVLGVGMAASAASSNVNIMGMANRFLPPVREYVDPVWWRNAIGGALLILGKDVWSLVRQVMERKRADSRRIESLPFREGLDV